MRAITILPGVPNSARLDEVGEPSETDGGILVRTRALGICGTDYEILEGLYGAAPRGQERLILGHESLGVVEDAPAASGFRRGDHVVGIVRRPDPVPCPACGSGEWDMCRNSLYTERGIKERHGFGAEHFRIEPEFAVKAEPALGLLAVLTEPASVVVKAWEQVFRIGSRSPSWAPARVLVTGAGPIGLLAALVGMQHGLSVHVFDRHKEGRKPKLVRDLGGSYHHSMDSLGEMKFDVVMECTAASPVIADAVFRCAPSGIVCLVGVSAAGKREQFDIGGFNRTLVLGNGVVFGTVNANRRHYENAARALAKANNAWLGELISRRVPLARWQEAFAPQPDDIKVVIDFTGG
jgi:threonine dehydrogenase-like Zn-dependent dehydrogenase